MPLVGRIMHEIPTSIEDTKYIGRPQVDRRMNLKDYVPQRRQLAKEKFYLL